MTLTRTFKVSGLVLLAGILLANLGGEEGLAEFVKVIGVLAIVLATPVFGVSALRHLLRGLLWRVGSRLFVSYLLIGVLPLLLVAGLALAALFILAGQVGARRAETRLLARLEALEAKASEFAGRDRVRRPEMETGSGAFDGWALLPRAGATEGDGPLGTDLGKIVVPERGLRAFVRSGEKTFLLVERQTKAGVLFLYRSADTTLERSSWIASASCVCFMPGLASISTSTPNSVGVISASPTLVQKSRKMPICAMRRR